MSATAIVLAGSRPGGDPFAEQFGTDLKALILVGGEPMVRRPVRALLESRRIAKILVLAQDPDRIAAVLPRDPRLTVRRSFGTIAETILDLIATDGLEWPLLVTTADHALLDSVTIDEICAQSVSSDISIGVVEKTNLVRRLPLTKRTWLRFRGGSYTGANLFGLRSPAVVPAIELWRSVEQDRKKAWRVIGRLGPLTIVLVALCLFSLDEVLSRLGRRLGLSIKAVQLANPLAGVDVDKAEDHALVEAILRGEA